MMRPERWKLLALFMLLPGITIVQAALPAIGRPPPPAAWQRLLRWAPTP